jgi:hypothetical protein
MELKQEIEHTTSNMRFKQLIISREGIMSFATKTSMIRCPKSYILIQ